MKTTILAAIAAASIAAAPAVAGNLSEPIMEPAIIEAEAASSSANETELVMFTLTALIFITAFATAN